MSPIKILFICVHNSARSQMAEAFLKTSGKGRFETESAGLEPGQLNPIVVDAMKQAGIDISRNKTQSVLDLFKQGKTYDYVITVCSGADSERCPIFPGGHKKLHWPFDDPSGLTGPYEEKLSGTISIREQIRKKVEEFIQSTEE